MTRGCYTHLLQ